MSVLLSGCISNKNMKGIITWSVLVGGFLPNSVYQMGLIRKSFASSFKDFTFYFCSRSNKQNVKLKFECKSLLVNWKIAPVVYIKNFKIGIGGVFETLIYDIWLVVEVFLCSFKTLMNEIIIRGSIWKLLLNSKLVFTQLVISVYDFFSLLINIEIWYT